MIMSDKHSGSLFIVAAPSGGGKTSLVWKLINDLTDIEISVSHTTRPKRPGEQHGVDYYFIDENEFQSMVNNDEFIEHASVFGHYYGTSKSQIYKCLTAGVDVLLDIDWQGAAQIKQNFKEAIGIFIIPPSLEALQQRLSDRQQDDQDVINARMKKAQDELSHYKEFDYLIVNDVFDIASNELESIVIAHRLRMSRQLLQQQELLSFLLA
jgi:guanylate kinase